MLLNKRLIISIFLGLVVPFGAAATAGDGSLPLRRGDGSLPLRTSGHAVVLDSIAEDALETSTEVTIAMVDDMQRHESLMCNEDTKAHLAAGTLKVGDQDFGIEGLCFTAETQTLVVFASRTEGEDIKKATLRGVLNQIEDKNLRRLKGRLTIEERTSQTKRFMMEAEEVAPTELANLDTLGESID